MAVKDFSIQSLTKNCNETLILAMLYHQEKHGYELALELERKSKGQFRFNHGTLYPILHKLEKDGYIKGNWQQEGPKRKRKYYSITNKGKEYALTQLSDWKNFIENFLKIVGEI